MFSAREFAEGPEAMRAAFLEDMPWWSLWRLED